MTEHALDGDADVAIPTAKDLLAAASIMLGSAFDKDPTLREWTVAAVAKQHTSFPGAAIIQSASEAILAEVDMPAQSEVWKAFNADR